MNEELLKEYINMMLSQMKCGGEVNDVSINSYVGTRAVVLGSTTKKADIYAVFTFDREQPGELLSTVLVCAGERREFRYNPDAEAAAAFTPLG